MKNIKNNVIVQLFFLDRINRINLIEKKLFLRILFISKLNPAIDYFYIIHVQKQRAILRKWSIAIDQNSVHQS